MSEFDKVAFRLIHAIKPTGNHKLEKAKASRPMQAKDFFLSVNSGE